jgi:hypothetical protein
MAQIVFDHTKEETLEAIGFTKDDLESLNHKLANISKLIILEQPKQSVVIQKIAETFSYKELLVVATMFVVDKTLDMVKNNPLLAIVELLKDRGE